MFTSDGDVGAICDLLIDVFYFGRVHVFEESIIGGSARAVACRCGQGLDCFDQKVVSLVKGFDDKGSLCAAGDNLIIATSNHISTLGSVIMNYFLGRQ